MEQRDGAEHLRHAVTATGGEPSPSEGVGEGYGAGEAVDEAEAADEGSLATGINR